MLNKKTAQEIDWDKVNNITESIVKYAEKLEEVGLSEVYVEVKGEIPAGKKTVKYKGHGSPSGDHGQTLKEK